MSIREYKENGTVVESYVGCVYREKEHMWMDGMLEVLAYAWDIKNHETKQIQVGYIGIDGRNMNDTGWDIDLTKEIAHDMIKTYRAEAIKEIGEREAIDRYLPRIGKKCMVIKGRKVSKGTVLTPFWIGEKPKFREWEGMEKIAGCYTEDGSKVWIKAEYLKAIETPDSLNRKQRKQLVNKFFRKYYPEAINVLTK